MIWYTETNELNFTPSGLGQIGVVISSDWADRGAGSAQTWVHNGNTIDTIGFTSGGDGEFSTLYEIGATTTEQTIECTTTNCDDARILAFEIPSSYNEISIPQLELFAGIVLFIIGLLVPVWFFKRRR